jgi:signal transduction histidine kinase
VIDGGQIGGVMITGAETTDSVLSARRTTALRDIADAADAVHSVDEGCRQALAAVARHPSDIPFALLYLRDPGEERARLVATAGLPRGGTASPESIELGELTEISGWPIAAALRTNAAIVVDDVLARFGALPAGNWPFAPRCAVVVPLTSPGRDEPDGVLVAGVSARHAFDAPYRGFIELVVKQIAAAIAGGRVHEEGERYAAARAAGRLARTKRRARVRAMKARFAGILEERTRLAREIHDTILQGVTGIALQLRAVHPRVRTSPGESADALERIVELAEKTSRDARQAVWDMRPAALADGDLVRALEMAARRLAADAAIDLKVSVSGEAQRMSANRQAATLRIVQEAVANVVRHAAARAIRLRLRYGKRRLRVDVTDDGHGFAVEPDFRSYKGHWGLLGMQERANSVGGALLVRSAPAAGTTVTFVLPYNLQDRGISRAS